jgi:hypothetical protein
MDVTCQANLTMPHELGHNMGARHDWYIDSNNNSPYTYNHGHTNTAGHWRTVMAYPDACNPNCLRVPYFSNPDVTYLGSATGVPEGQPNAADNRKTLNNTALVTNAFRSISVGDGTKADINGDGRDDVLSFQQGGTGQVWGATSNGSTFNTPTHWNPWGAFSYNGHVPAVGDLNGDGRDDMLNFQQGPGTGGEVWAALSNGTTFNTPTRWNPWGAFSYTGHLPAVGDVNGDGRADIVNFQQSNGQVWVALSNGSSFNTPTLWNPWGAFSYEGHVPRVGDVNGDGKADMVNFQRDAGGSVWVALSNGTTFNTPGQWGSGTAFSFRKATPRLGDVNGDGRADAVNFRQGTSGQVFVGLSTGSGFSPGVEWNPWGAFSYIANVPFTADLNGDGKADILNFQQGSNGQIWGATANLLGTQFNLPTHWNPWGPFSYGGSVPI